MKLLYVFVFLRSEYGGKPEKPEKQGKSEKSEKSKKPKQEKQEKQEKQAEEATKEVPVDFKLSQVINAIVNMKDLESDISNQTSQLSHLRVDASDLEAVKQVKGDKGHLQKLIECLGEASKTLSVLVNNARFSDSDNHPPNVFVPGRRIIKTLFQKRNTQH